jgi:hypothetical protein
VFTTPRGAVHPPHRASAEPGLLSPVGTPVRASPPCRRSTPTPALSASRPAILPGRGRSDRLRLVGLAAA